MKEGVGLSSFDIREEIPVKSFSIAAFICRVVDDEAQYLIIKRSSRTLYGSWQMVSGQVEPGENGVQAALREIEEETGLVPSNFYSANLCEQFYDTDYNVINLVPVFVAFVGNNSNVVLNENEHSDYKWISIEEAEDYLIFDNQIKNMHHIDKMFIKREPNPFLEIKVYDYI